MFPRKFSHLAWEVRDETVQTLLNVINPLYNEIYPFVTPYWRLDLLWHGVEVKNARLVLDYSVIRDTDYVFSIEENNHSRTLIAVDSFNAHFLDQGWQFSMQNDNIILSRTITRRTPNMDKHPARFALELP